MQPISLSSGQMKSALLEDSDAGEIVVPDFGEQLRLSNRIEGHLQGAIPISLPAGICGHVDADIPAVVYTVETDHAKLSLIVGRDEDRPILIHDRFLEPSDMAGPIDCPGRLAHRDSVGIVPPLENIEGVFDRRSPNLDHGHDYRSICRGLSRAMATGAALTAASALAQPACAVIDQIEAKLAAEFQEVRTVEAISDRSLLMIVFAPRDGATWTLVMVRPGDMIACLVASGGNLQIGRPEALKPAEEAL